MAMCAADHSLIEERPNYKEQRAKAILALALALVVLVVLGVMR